MNKEFNSKLTYGKIVEYVSTKIKAFGDTIKTNFNNNKIPKENTPYKCLSLIMLECVIRTEGDFYYPQTSLEECKYEVKNVKRKKCIDYDFDKSSSDKSDSEPDSGTDSDSDSEIDSESEKAFKKSDHNKSENSSKKSDNIESKKSSKKPD